MSINTCSLHMLRVVRVCGLPNDVSSSELKPGKQQYRVSIIFTRTVHTTGFRLLCVVHSHIDGVWLQRSIAEIIGVVLLHTVIVLSDHVRFGRSATEPHRGLVVSRHTDLCGHA